MNFIKEVKARADIVKVAEFYGLQLNRANKCKCPFHQERTASFSISQSKQIFKCFGCGVGGDCITLVAKLLNINNYQAAESINNNLGLGLDSKSKTTYAEINKYKIRREIEEKFKKWEFETKIFLCDYLHFLSNKKEELKPKNINNISENYVKVINELDKVKYFLDLFLNGTSKDKIWFQKIEKRWLDNARERFSR